MGAIMYGLKLITPPAYEPVALEEHKRQCRVDADQTDDDTLIRAYGYAAREWVETYLGRQLVKATYELQLPAFPTSCDSYTVELPRPPLVSVTSVKYLDADGAEQTLDPAGYVVLPHDGTLVFNPSSVPSVFGTFARPDVVRVRYVCGETAVEDVPETAKLAIKLLTAEWYVRREVSVEGTIVGEVPVGLDRLLGLQRIKGVR
jgi:uncharacterized phiE125 gp8 family phage protein